MVLADFLLGGAGTGVGPLTGFGWAGVGNEGGPGIGVGSFVGAIL
jgi:hypothetical protein